MVGQLSENTTYGQQPGYDLLKECILDEVKSIFTSELINENS